jgi:hypothetical protein
MACVATIGWHGWMKAAGAFNDLPRELRHNMPRYSPELALMRVHAVCDAAHCRASPLHVKD